MEIPDHKPSQTSGVDEDYSSPKVLNVFLVLSPTTQDAAAESNKEESQIMIDTVVSRKSHLRIEVMKKK